MSVRVIPLFFKQRNFYGQSLCYSDSLLWFLKIIIVPRTPCCAPNVPRYFWEFWSRTYSQLTSFFCIWSWTCLVLHHTFRPRSSCPFWRRWMRTPTEHYSIPSVVSSPKSWVLLPNCILPVQYIKCYKMILLETFAFVVVRKTIHCMV